MATDLIDLLETMAVNGEAPLSGCSLFGVGYEDTFLRLRNVFLRGRLAQRGKSAQKFVVGPFGSGKTHFLRQLMEISREDGFVTSEVSLDSDIDYTNRLMVYREVLRNIRVPGSKNRGLRNLLERASEKVRGHFPDSATAETVLQGWIRGLDKVDIKLNSYARVVQKAMENLEDGDQMVFDAACNWLSGTFDNKVLARELREPFVSKTEMNLFAGQALLSLFQFIRYAGFNGTVVGYDEADIGFQVDRKKMQTILGMLRADIGAINDLEGGAVFIVFALTPYVVQQMDQYMALKQRIAVAPGQGFFDGNDYAALIDLSSPTDRQEELREIGYRLADLLYQTEGLSIPDEKEQVYQSIDKIAEEVLEEDTSSSSRRDMVKRSSVLLLKLIGTAYFPGEVEAAAAAEDEV